MSAALRTCVRCESRLEHGDQRCPVCTHSAPAPPDRPEASVEIQRCSGCGAAVTWDAAVGGVRCAFCGSATRLERRDDPPEQVELYLPFRVDAAQARGAFRSWLAGLSWFRPGSLRAESTVESLQPLLWVGWLCRGRAIVSWTADSDADARRARWAPHAGQSAEALDGLVVSGSRGLTPSETDALVRGYRLDTAGDRPEGAPPGTVVEQFDLPRSAARRHLLEVLDRVVRWRLERGAIPGSRFRNLHTALLLHGFVTRRLAFPCHVLAYRYRGRLHRVVVSGQDPERVLGSAPWSLPRILLALLAAALGLVLGLAALRALS